MGPQSGCRRAMIVLGSILMAGCASTGPDDGRRQTACEELQAACDARCEAAFESEPDTWEYRSCLASCEPDPGAICNRR